MIIENNRPFCLLKRLQFEIREYDCMKDAFARARTRPKGQARATIGYLVNKEYTCLYIDMRDHTALGY